MTTELSSLGTTRVSSYRQRSNEKVSVIVVSLIKTVTNLPEKENKHYKERWKIQFYGTFLITNYNVHIKPFFQIFHLFSGLKT